MFNNHNLMLLLCFGVHHIRQIHGAFERNYLAGQAGLFAQGTRRQLQVFIKIQEQRIGKQAGWGIVKPDVERIHDHHPLQFFHKITQDVR